MGIEQFKPVINSEEQVKEVEPEKIENPGETEKKDGPSIFGKVMQKIETHNKWKEVEQAASELGYGFKMFSDEDYYKGKPLPRGGALFAMGATIYVRKGATSPEKAMELIEKIKEGQKERGERTS